MYIAIVIADATPLIIGGVIRECAVIDEYTGMGAAKGTVIKNATPFIVSCVVLECAIVDSDAGVLTPKRTAIVESSATKCGGIVGENTTV